MIVEIPIKHEAHTKVRGRVKPRWYDAVVPVHVAEVTGAQAPIAAWIPLENTGGIERMAVRWHEGDLYRPVVEGTHVTFANRTGSRIDGDDVSPDGGATALRGGKRTKRVLTTLGLSRLMRDVMSEHASMNRLSDVTGTVLSQDKTVREIVSDTLVERSADMQATASRMICIDGCTFIKTTQPVLAVTPRDYQVLRHEWSDRVVDPSGCFPVTRFDEAVEKAKGMRSRTLDARQVKSLRPEVVDATLLDADFARWMTRTVARMAMHSMSSDRNGYGSGSELSARSRETMVAFFHLREAMTHDEATDVILSRLSSLDGCINGGLERELSLDDHGSGRLLARIRSEMAIDLDLSNAPTF